MKEDLTMDELIDTVNYRDFSVPVYKNNYSQIYTIIGGKIIKLSCKLEDYRKYVEETIDRFVDNLQRFEITKNSYLEYFNNGGHFDLRFVSDGRIMKIFLVKDGYELTKDTIDNLIDECKNILYRLN